MKILIMGLPGSGKTTLAEKLCAAIEAEHINADQVRKLYNDWDFSIEGRIRQAKRMLSISRLSDKPYVIIDFVCPLKEIQDSIDVDFIIWMDTIKKSRFTDTNKVFNDPAKFNLRITKFDYSIEEIIKLLR